MQKNSVNCVEIVVDFTMFHIVCNITHLLQETLNILKIT